MEIFEFKIDNKKYTCLYKEVSAKGMLGIIIKEIPTISLISNHIEDIAYQIYKKLFYNFKLEKLVWFELLDNGIEQKISKVKFDIYTKDEFLNPTWEEIKEIDFTSMRKFNQKLQNYLTSEENIVKQTAKELGMTQKELAEHIKVSEDTMSNWSRGKIKTPEWAIKMFELLKTEKKYNTIREFFLKTE